MKLLIDIGNTRVKLARLDGRELQFLAAFATEDEQALVEGISEHVKSSAPHLAPHSATYQAAWGVCVGAPELQRLVQTAVGASTPIQWVSSSASAAGITNSYPDPTQLGADRWVAIVGLIRHFTAGGAVESALQKSIDKSPSLVLATFGTATTVDTLGGDLTFRGGLILPGVVMMRHSLAAGTARLPAASGQVADNPTNTTSAIASGIVAAQIGALTRQVAIAQQQDGVPPVVCVSGGAYEEVRLALDKAMPGFSGHHLPHVVLDGLAVLANQTV